MLGGGGTPAMLGHVCNELIVFDVSEPVTRGHQSNVERGQYIVGLCP